MMATLSAARVRKAKRAFVTRRVGAGRIRTLVCGDVLPRAGDLLLARVAKIGHHGRLENPHGRRMHLFSGDEIIACYANRYAPDQFEAEVPTNLGPAHLVAAGGIIGRALSWHDRIVRPTAVMPIALLGDASGRVLNLEDFSLGVPGRTRPKKPAIAVVGASMNSGKTTMAASLVKGLVRAGHVVGAAKLTGTGAGGDIWKLKDAGATTVLDFTDAGFASTYRVGASELERICHVLFGRLASSRCSALVLEVADGLYQQETANLLQSSAFQQHVQGILFAAGEAMSAAAAVEWLRANGHPVLGLGGRITRAPLAKREAESAAMVPCYTNHLLQLPHIAAALLSKAVELLSDRAQVAPESSAVRGRIGAELLALGPSRSLVCIEGLGRAEDRFSTQGRYRRTVRGSG